MTQSEGVRGPGTVRRDIPARANAFKSTKPGLPRPPRSATVSVTAPDGSGVTYADAMLTVRREINCSELNIAKVDTRSVVTRAVILEIAGREREVEREVERRLLDFWSVWRVSQGHPRQGHRTAENGGVKDNQTRRR